MTAEGLTQLIKVYGGDYVIMFHSPWCDHCQQLTVYLEVMAENLNDRGNNVTLRTFDCETDVFAEGMFGVCHIA